MRPDSTNAIFQIAADFVNNTSRHVFLTGKAGTGKTTFLKHIKSTNAKTNGKKIMVIAPTGVAAINAGGVTMHSFFQLPFTPFIPTSDANDATITYKDGYFKNKRVMLKKHKQNLLREIELLIIDEISMVRADTLDAIDAIMRKERKQYDLPFGGVQMLYIGDMYQLPPVINEQEWQILSEHYASPFFFDARVIQEAPPLYIELKKIYRQTDQKFISILNSVRNNITTQEELQLLNSRWIPDFVPEKEGKYITLTTHNSAAEEINTTELEKLPGKQYDFKGEITGDFNEKLLPADPVLQLKEGAQVMFIKNDKGDSRRYYNGKLAIVKKVNYERIVVAPVDSDEEITLERETWRNIKYNLTDVSKEIVEEELGTFKQYPIKLAWAVTIHKSQGLTFEKAIIDAGYAFAAGQVYVALSRCTSLEGIVLYSRIGAHNISTDYRVVEFAQREASQEYLEPVLAKEKKAYELAQIKKMFSNWIDLEKALRDWQAEIIAKKLDKQADAVLLNVEMVRKAMQQKEVADKFRIQLEGISATIENPDSVEKLNERMKKAVEHFTKAIYEELIIPLNEHIKEVKKGKPSKVKSYLEEVGKLEDLLWNKIYFLWNASYNGKTFSEGLKEYRRPQSDTADPSSSDKAVVTKSSATDISSVANFPIKPTVKTKLPIGTTRIESLRQYKEGKTIDEIAQLRNLARGTIESHLAESIGLGEIDLEAVLNADRIAAILPVVQKLGHVSLTPIRQELGDDFTFTEIRMVAQHVKRMALMEA